MYIQEYRKKVMNLLEICQVVFNHGAVGHSAMGEHRSKISSGAISLAKLWSSALLEYDLLHHHIRIHTGGQVSLFSHQERHPVSTKMHVSCCCETKVYMSSIFNVCTQHRCKYQRLLSSF